tara:strand:- start:474 stop:626 length:153 start_codon:yes stop_codon:yes gene_type:complete
MIKVKKSFDKGVKLYLSSINPQIVIKKDAIIIFSMSGESSKLATRKIKKI